MAAFRTFARIAVGITLIAMLSAAGRDQASSDRTCFDRIPAKLNKSGLALPPLATANRTLANAQPFTRIGSKQIASSFFYPEVRLRKLHLVRPDLIPYPIYYKIYC